MNRCYLCHTELSVTNVTLEHVIPNCIGGKLKSNSIICNECNNYCGRTLEKVLCQVGTPFASKYNIKRERGSVPNLRGKLVDTNDPVIIEPNSIVRPVNPTIEEDEIAQRIKISASDKRGLFEETKRLEKDLTKKGKILTSTSAINESEIKLPAHEINISVDKDTLLRAMAKVIASYFYMVTNNLDSLNEVRKFIRYGGENNWIWFYTIGISEKIFSNHPYHTIIIVGDSNQRIAYGYFELFGRMGFVCALDFNYVKKNNIESSYIFDPINGTINSSKISFSISKDVLRRLIDEKRATNFNGKY